MAYRQQQLLALTLLYPERARAQIEKALEHADTVEDAAISLGICRASLYNYLKRLGLDPPGLRKADVAAARKARKNG